MPEFKVSFRNPPIPLNDDDEDEEMKIQSAFWKVCLVSLVLVGSGFADEPWAYEKPLISPSKTFSIHQKRKDSWYTTIHFFRDGRPDIQFSDDYSWPALFYISPDDKWMLQIQKTGSGDNTSFLLKVDQEGRCWRMEPKLMEHAWTFLEDSHSIKETGLYHTGIDFGSWDLKDHSLHFTFHASCSNKPDGLHIPLRYDLKSNVLTFDSKK